MSEAKESLQKKAIAVTISCMQAGCKLNIERFFMKMTTRQNVATLSVEYSNFETVKEEIDFRVLPVSRLRIEHRFFTDKTSGNFSDNLQFSFTETYRFQPENFKTENFVER